MHKKVTKNEHALAVCTCDDFWKTLIAARAAFRYFLFLEMWKARVSTEIA